MKNISQLLVAAAFTASGMVACNSNQQKTGTSADSATVQSNAADTVSAEAFHQTVDGKQVELYTLHNNNGLKTQITNYGGRIVSLWVPDKNGKLTDVVAGHVSLNDYQKSTGKYFGALIGRYGNRIAKGRFTLDGKEYKLFINNGVNSLHGGDHGYQGVVWDAKQLNAHTLELTYLSKDMEAGYPGNLNIKVTYELTDDNQLKISYNATTDKNTVINLTNHAFFNLNGEASGTVLNHLVKINADGFTPVDTTLIPTGKIEPVKGTPFDFTTATALGARIEQKHPQLINGKGYDHNFVLKPHQLTNPVAEVTGDVSGIVMTVYTNEPGLQFYSGNFMKGENTMKGGHKDDLRTAFCMETQHYPDSPNQPAFPSTVLKPGAVYQTTTLYKFSVNK